MGTDRPARWKAIWARIPTPEIVDYAFRASLSQLAFIDRWIDERESQPQPTLGPDYGMESYLADQTLTTSIAAFWVLAGYELVRTLAEGVKDSSRWQWCVASHADIVRVKRAFEAVRMPLAKIEIPRSFEGQPGIWPVALPAYGENKEPGWLIADDRVVTRGELADHLVDVMEKAVGLKPPE